MPFHAGYVVCHCPLSGRPDEDDDEDHGSDEVVGQFGSMGIVEKVVGRGGVTVQLVAGVVVTEVDSVADSVVGSATDVTVLSVIDDDLDTEVVVGSSVVSTAVVGAGVVSSASVETVVVVVEVKVDVESDSVDVVDVVDVSVVVSVGATYMVVVMVASMSITEMVVGFECVTVFVSGSAVCVTRSV